GTDRLTARSRPLAPARNHPAGIGALAPAHSGSKEQSRRRTHGSTEQRRRQQVVLMIVVHLESLVSTHRAGGPAAARAEARRIRRMSRLHRHLRYLCRGQARFRQPSVWPVGERRTIPLPCARRAPLTPSARRCPPLPPELPRAGR